MGSMDIGADKPECKEPGKRLLHWKFILPYFEFLVANNLMYLKIIIL